MATVEDAEAHREAVSSVVTLAFADLAEAWASTLYVEEAREVVRRLLEFLPSLVGDYGSAVGAVSADWYDDLRDVAGAPTGFRASPAEVDLGDTIEPLVRWAVDPIFAAEPDPDAALSRLAGGTQRLLAGVDRDTIAQSVAADPGQPVYARHASANACTFCRLLATRDAVYGSEESATRVVGSRGAAQIRAVGDLYHSSCHCVAVPVWPGQEFERAPYVDGWQQAYLDARDTARSGDLKKILAEMRKSMGSR